ncbi:beta-microseminoprotein-like [Anneissia japonica]|uniref:beta-microseminoprotein-like n=1 Tax=Anneissia japonica TaxID=1529436 RepID=UPI0014258D1E|nr:beta-microseminoprotein-like [Anneissia japonica]
MTPKEIILSLCVLASVVCLSYAQCETHEKPCIYENKIYGSLEKWTTKDCKTCTCSYAGNGYQCCRDAWMPIDYSWDDCVPVWDEDNCVYRLVRIEDPDVECEVMGGVM